MACCGDVPTLETMAAVDMLRRELPDLRVRVVNVVDLMRLQPESEHPHGMTDTEFDTIFTTDRPVIFAFHGYPMLIHRLTYRRTNHGNLHVRGYKEQGTTTTPFDMVMLNDLDRFHLVIDVVDRVPDLEVPSAALRQQMVEPRPPRGPPLHPRARRGCTRDHRLVLAGLTRRSPAVQTQAVRTRRLDQGRVMSLVRGVDQRMHMKSSDTTPGRGDGSRSPR